jgi:hypothetical protein
MKGTTHDAPHYVITPASYHSLYLTYTGKPRYMLFRSMRISVNTVTNIYTIPLYVPPKISNIAADYEIKNF